MHILKVPICAAGRQSAVAPRGYARTIVFFRWHGSDDMTEVTGEGSAELQDDCTI